MHSLLLADEAVVMTLADHSITAACWSNSLLQSWTATHVAIGYLGQAPYLLYTQHHPCNWLPPTHIAASEDRFQPTI